MGTRTEETAAIGGGNGSACASNGCESAIVGRTLNIGMVAGLVRRLESKTVGGVRGDSSKNQSSSRVATKLGFSRFARYETRRNFFQFREITRIYAKFRELREFLRNGLRQNFGKFREISC